MFSRSRKKISWPSELLFRDHLSWLLQWMHIVIEDLKIKDLNSSVHRISKQVLRRVHSSYRTETVSFRRQKRLDNIEEIFHHIIVKTLVVDCLLHSMFTKKSFFFTNTFSIWSLNQVNYSKVKDVQPEYKSVVCVLRRIILRHSILLLPISLIPSQKFVTRYSVDIVSVTSWTNSYIWNLG